MLQVNLGGRLSDALEETDCVVRSSDFRVVIEERDLATFPDLSVVCGGVIPAKRYRHSCVNPLVLVEVLSPDTEAYDRGIKFEQYRKLSSLREYVLVSTEAVAIDVFRLEDGHWVLYPFRGEEAVLELRTLKASIPLSRIYRKVRLDPATAG